MPTADILCLECHGPEFPQKSYVPDEWKHLLEPMPLKEGFGVTFCDKCRTDIQIDESASAEHNLVDHLQKLGVEATMAQTGGMNSGGEITCQDGGWYLFFFRENRWSLVRFDAEGETVGESFNALFSKEFIDHILEKKEIKKQ